MDSDDTIPADCGRQLRELVDGEHPAERLGYVMQVHCPGPGEAGRHDVTVVDHVKLFRNRPDLRFEHRIHEQILPAIRRAGGEVAFTDIFVVHSGSDHSAAGRVRKLERDFKLLHLDLQERPDHPFVLFNLGMTYADARQFDEADRWLTRCLEVSQPQESHVRKAYALLLSVLYQQARHAEADTVCVRARQLYPDDKELLFRQAMLQHALGRLEEAAATYREVLDAPAERHFASVDAELAGIKARHNLAVVLGDLGAWNAAVCEWNTILSSQPDYGPAQEGLRQALQSQSAAVVASRRGAVHRPSQQTVRAGPGS
jgi:tetratricopeptide (TPR) repeat protein